MTARDEANFGLPEEGAVAALSPARRLVSVLDAERVQWFNWSPVLVGLGIGLYFTMAREPHALVALAPFGAALAMLIARPHSLPNGVAVALVCVTSGFAIAKLRTEWTRAPVIERRMTYVEVRGFAELVEQRVTRGERVTMRVISLGELPREKIPYRVRVRSLSGSNSVKPGDAIRVRATLAPPGMPVIPGGYDFARSAWFQGIGAVGYAIRGFEPDASLGAVPFSLRWRAAIEGLRHDIGERVRAVLPGETGAIATALITGERGGITQATNDTFRASGLFHILSISGLHMVVMAGAMFYAVRLLLAAIPAIALRYPIKKWAAAAAAIAAFGYLLISGAAFATVRSYIMISVIFVAVLLDRPPIALRNVATSALIILFLFPESLLDVGFQMSYAAVVALVSTYEFMSRRRSGTEPGPQTMLTRPLRFLGGIVFSTLVAGLAVAPFAAYHFHTSQQFAALANLFAIPICNVVVMPAALLSLVLIPLGLEAPALWLLGQGIEGITWCARFAASLPGAVGHIAAMPKHAFLLMVAGGMWLCLWSTRWRLLGLSALAMGAAMGSVPRLPDILVGRDGALIAVRGPQGLLNVAAGRQSKFELKRWLEHDGDARTVDQAAKQSTLVCDHVGCTTNVRGRVVSMARHPAALDDDCTSAEILVLDFPAPRGCSRPRYVVDFFQLRNEGTHAFYWDGAGSWTIETVAQARGERPWAKPGTLGAKWQRAVKRSVRPAARVRADPPRPEVEDDDL